jgi:hypothetical protein
LPVSARLKPPGPDSSQVAMAEFGAGSIVMVRGFAV